MGDGRIYCTDLEGPVTKNDNAAELAAHVVPDGAALFKRVSLYDDYLAEVVRRPGYRAGDTLRLVLPFMMAHGLTAEGMLAFAREGILMVPGADRVLRELARTAPSYVISTSYCQYVRAVLEAVGFPPEQAFCTRIDLDDYAIPEDEVPTVQAWGRRILSREPIEIPDGASGPGDLSERDRATVLDLDSMFWEELPELAVYGVVEETRTVGGPEKAVSVRRAAEREGADLSGVVYVGDSITDVEAFRTVRRGGGLAVSFNGNGWAVREADLALVSERADIVLAAVREFLAEGHEAVRGRVWGDGSAETVCQWTQDADVEALVERSERVRKQVRGQVVGGLG